MEGDKINSKITITYVDPRIIVDMSTLPLYSSKTKVLVTYEEMTVCMQIGEILSKLSLEYNIDNCFLVAGETEICVELPVYGNISCKALSKEIEHTKITGVTIKLANNPTIRFLIKR